MVANPTVPDSDLTLDGLRDLFFFRVTFWERGGRVNVLLPASGLESGQFLQRAIYRMPDRRMKRLILEKLYRGEIDIAPDVANTDEEAVSMVAATPGSVAVVRADAVGQSEVKRLLIDGKRPGDAEYPLTL